MGEQERRFFHALCYAVGAEKALLQAVFRARIWRGKGFIPYPPKPRFYCVTKSTAKGVIYYGSFQSGTEQGLHRNEQPPPTQQGAFLLVA